MEHNFNLDGLNEEKATFTIINDEGVEVECEILFICESEENGKNYIVYTDNSLDEEGNTKVYASTFDPNEEDPVLNPIETEEEFAHIEKMLAELTGEAE